MSKLSGLEVVIPARNAEATLPECLAALRAAGFHPAEIVLVNDASADATASLARERGVRVVELTTPRGPAEARNIAVEQCTAPLIFFVDADVAVHITVRTRILGFFESHPHHAGLIGSYDDAPPAPGGLSRIRNLLHHHVHQKSPGDVRSFWTGCGAIRREAFSAVGGFDPQQRLEDVALGFRLARQGRAVRLDPTLLCTHLKRWTLRSMLRADLLNRALPWSRLLLDPRNADVGPALNADPAGQLSVLAAGLSVAGLLLSPALPVLGCMAATMGLLALVAANRRFLTLVARLLGTGRALQAVPVLLAHYLCAGAGFAWALAERLGRRRRI